MVESVNYCIACNLKGIDCCNTPHQIIIGIKEAMKIHKETALKYSDFIGYVNLGKEQFEDAFIDLLPNGKSLAMKRAFKGACYFFTENGCSIPKMRPKICKVFPIWYDQEVYKMNNSIVLFIEERDCLIGKKMKEFDNFEDACKLFGSSENKLKNYFRNFLDEMDLFRSCEQLFESLSLDAAFERIENALTSQDSIQVQIPTEKSIPSIE